MCEPVPMGAKAGVAAFPSRKRIADRVVAHVQTRRFAKPFDIGARAHVGLAKDNARHNGRLSFGDLRQSHQLCDEPVDA